jgi:hypothetical protein
MASRKHGQNIAMVGNFSTNADTRPWSLMAGGSQNVQIPSRNINPVPCRPRSLDNPFVAAKDQHHARKRSHVGHWRSLISPNRYKADFKFQAKFYPFLPPETLKVQ